MGSKKSRKPLVLERISTTEGTEYTEKLKAESVEWEVAKI